MNEAPALITRPGLPSVKVNHRESCGAIVGGSLGVRLQKRSRSSQTARTASEGPEWGCWALRGSYSASGLTLARPPISDPIVPLQVQARNCYHYHRQQRH